MVLNQTQNFRRIKQQYSKNIDGNKCIVCEDKYKLTSQCIKPIYNVYTIQFSSLNIEYSNRYKI